MGGTSNRLKQTPADVVEDATTDGEEEFNEPLPNVDICAKIYAYCEVATEIVGADAYPQYDPAVHGRPLYVGQSIQELKIRDKQHLGLSYTVFDRQYTKQNQYVLVLLAERRFAAAEKDEDFKDDTLHPAGAWMDCWETKFISEFDTFVNGFNRTKGGQGSGWLVAIREAKARVMYKRFLTTYMPAFRDFYEETERTHVNASQTHPILGQLLHSIRTGNTQVPPQFEEELRCMGLDLRNQHIVQRDTRWEEEYMPAFRDYYDETKRTHVNASRSHPILGSLLHSIRTGNTQVPPQFEEELRSMRLFWCASNLARHVTRVLKREVKSLEDVEAKKVVTEAAMEHSRILTRRRGIKGKKALSNAGLYKVPFGTKPLGDGTARFAADLKRLKQEESTTKKRKRS